MHGGTKFYPEYFLELNETYSNKDPAKKTEILNSLFALTQFAFEAELYIGYFQIPRFIESIYGAHITKGVIGSVANIKRFADQFLEHSKNINELESRGIVILTEGASELNFLTELYPDRNFDVVDYDGEGNKKRKSYYL
ncbi:hypothetical protein [Microbulbifer sp. VAAF005]|uniref:hypothetical protein n=1 Tax=Microbulbifer sp. VAAF005 TaxID=3034230 RepID=UPI0024ACFF00|nr:hypothetical protein [Microbulbifer sp. VAAF005]WHI46778.1 hypothetical protein P0078_24290 [Microbulbifer sp. VAAF005]